MHLARAVSAVALISMSVVGCGEPLPGTEGKVAPQVEPELVARAQALSTDIFNGYPVTVQGGLGSVQSFRLVNPAPAAKLSFTLRGGSGDADLYVKAFAEPTFSDYDCLSDSVGNKENCAYTGVGDDEPYYVLVYGFEAFSGATLHAYYSNPISLATPVSISANRLARTVYEVDVPAGKKRLQVTATQTSAWETGPFNLYVRQGDAPAVPGAVDCATSNSTLPAVCTITNPVAGKAYIMIEGVDHFGCTFRVDALTK
ncbi:PPC domain-containing protein [Hyalangium versicolor]|uniref:PPC domain-containing protein n=1 Tax=Hyalangium versicolor TaxID=2861190 RepID=UPI001CC9109E|nr:PPC domain-containing protein [Hyalangium versicolor]